MRIKSYLAILVIACFIGAHMLEQVLAYHFNHVQTLINNHNDNLLWAKDIERIENSTTQLLVSSDLVIGSGNTYLILGTKNMGNYLTNELSELLAENRFVRLQGTIKRSIGNVHKINALLDVVGDFPFDELESRLSALLSQYDPVSLALSQDIQFISKETDVALTQEAAFLKEEKQSMVKVAWAARFVFFILIVGIWWWANRKICKPLNGLIASSHRALAGDEFKAVTKAPKEIIELSNDFTLLTETLFHQASHDPLTELQNRRAFERNLNDIIEDKTLNYFLCFIDLDYFKTINDTCGHAAGDEILVSVARILKQSVRGRDVVARLGGDEFAILIKDCPVDKVVQVADNIREKIRDLTYHWEGETFQLSASIGVAPKTTECTTTDLLHSADVACSLAKKAGRNNVHLFDISVEHSVEQREDVLSVHQINNAINNDLFVLYKQDITPLKQQGSGLCFEVLLRMTSTKGDIISPASFFPIAERYHLSSKIDRWVINAVCDYLANNKQLLDKIDMISINLSVHSLIDGELESFIVKCLQNNRLPGTKICFEITETAAISNIKRAKLFMENIKAFGCEFALDDFGSGHSSYAYIKEFPIDKIKIDGSYINSMMENPLDFTTVKSICEIAKTANQEVVAEFVENEKVLKALIKLGVDYAQGYFFHKPEPLI